MSAFFGFLVFLLLLLPTSCGFFQARSTLDADPVLDLTQTVRVDAPRGQVSLRIPADWTATQTGAILITPESDRFDTAPVDARDFPTDLSTTITVSAIPKMALADIGLSPDADLATFAANRSSPLIPDERGLRFFNIRDNGNLAAMITGAVQGSEFTVIQVVVEVSQGFGVFYVQTTEAQPFALEQILRHMAGTFDYRLWR